MSIDFGTSSSAAAILRDELPELVTPLMVDAAGSKLFPTVAYVDNQKKVLACHKAEQMCVHDLSRFIREFKLDMNKVQIPLLGVSYVEVVTEILKTLKSSAERVIGCKVENVVLTVPAIYRDMDPRQEIMYESASQAGFTKIVIIKEAQAAAIYYDYIEQSNTEKSSISLIYDLGGGTFDPALISHSAGGHSLLGNGGEGISVGGKFFTEAIVKHYVSSNGIKIAYRPGDKECIKKIQSIKSKCESIKRYLSEEELGSFPVEDTDKEYKLTRKEFEAMITGLLDRTLESCNLLVDENKLSWDKINRVLLIGGSCNIPLVRSKLRSYLDARNASNTAIVWRQTEKKKYIDPQFAVALGGIVYAKTKFMAPPPRPPLGFLSYGECGSPKNFTFPKEGVYVLGRKATDTIVDIAIEFGESEKKLISRKHLKFIVSYDKKRNIYEYEVEDIGSANGTYLNSVRILKCVKLNRGDIVRAGRHEFTLFY